MDMTDLEKKRHEKVLAALESAVAQRKIHLDYQAQNGLPDKQLKGLEALCRLDDDALGSITPDEFIPVAEQSGLIVALERLVLDHVAKDLPQLLSYHPHLRVGVNVSARSLARDGFFQETKEWLRHLPPSTIKQLDFEITETCFQNFSTQNIDGLKELRQSGIRIVMDDFGSGQSSLGRLHTLPFDAIKLDKQFAQQIDHPMVHAIVKAAIEFTQQFNIELIAEGVETAHQCDVLKSLGCQTVQGFYFGQPASVEHWLTFHQA